MPEQNDSELLNLYRQTRRETPSPASDEAILKAAQHALQEKPHAHAPFSGKWNVSLSLAAVVVLSVIIVTTLEDEQPDIYSGMEDVEVNVHNQPHSDNQPLSKAEQEVVLPPSAPSEASPPKASQDVSEILPATSPVKSKKQVSTKPVQPTRKLTSPPANPSAESEEDIASPTTELTAERIRPLIKEVLPTPDVAAVEVESVPKPAPQSTEVVSGVERMREKSEEKLATPALSSGDIRVGAGAAQLATEQASEFEPPMSRSVAEAVPQCASLSATQCMSSPFCMWVQSGEKLICRENTSHCEQGFTQFNATSVACESKPECKFIVEQCTDALVEIKNCPQKESVPALCVPLHDSE